MHECCVSSHKLTYKELYIFDFVNQVILSHIGMHPFMAYKVIPMPAQGLGNLGLGLRPHNK